ncbi:MAG TPA: hypothetical protein VFS12_14980 [Terriglobia bacterium]|nr:hypothetical protein [Terriglobia bacterium]
MTEEVLGFISDDHVSPEAIFLLGGWLAQQQRSRSQTGRAVATKLIHTL